MQPSLLPLVAPPPRVADFAGVWALWPDCLGNLRDWFAAAPLESRAPSPGALRLLPVRAGKSVAVIDVSNVLTKSGGWWSTGTTQLRQNVQQAAADPNVSGILLSIDSPGGTVAGTADLANDVRAARRQKPVWAQVNDLGASAAYWVASQADMVFANDPTALVGSIGTLLTVYDLSQAAKTQGVEALVFATGELKGAGQPGAPVTDGQRAYFQGIVNATQTYFDAAVRSGRGMTAAQLSAVRSGAVYPAAQALDLKLIDGIQPLDRTLKALADAR